MTKELNEKKNVDANFKTNMNLPKLDDNTFQSNENDKKYFKKWNDYKRFIKSL